MRLREEEFCFGLKGKFKYACRNLASFFCLQLLPHPRMDDDLPDEGPEVRAMKKCLDGYKSARNFHVLGKN